MDQPSRNRFFRLVSLNNIEEASEKTLTKHLGHSLKTVENFFIALKKSWKTCSHNNKIESFFEEKSSYNEAEFKQKVKIIDQSLLIRDIENVFHALSLDGNLSVLVILQELRKNGEKTGSSESSDISSPSDEEYIHENVNDDQVLSTFEFLQFKFKANSLSFQGFTEIANNILGNLADTYKLNKFFLTKEIRIEDGPERNRLISFLLNGKNKVFTSFLIQIFAEKCFNEEISNVL